MQDRYYRDKLGMDPRDPAASRRVVEHYMQARLWPDAGQRNIYFLHCVS